MFNHVRTRYAPSPTGYLHLGGLRTALFCYLFARHHNGSFIVRFEDTDLDRNVNDAIKQMLNSLKLLNLDIDEGIEEAGNYGPYKQSEKLEIYYKKALNLINNNKAYYCFCTKDELILERKRQIEKGYKAPRYSRKCLNLTEDEIKYNLKIAKKFTIRFKVEENRMVVFDDIVYGQIKFNTKHIEDFIIIKNNKFPTYNFAVVIDDHDMLISHVLRGSDHTTNTPKQILIFESFNWEIPKYGHLTLINNLGSVKMSKRNFDEKQYLDYYLKLGFIPLAICNYLALLGWCPELTKEIFTMEELIKKFDGSKLNKGNSTFSLTKLIWINKKQIKRLSKEEFFNYSVPFLGEFKSKPKIKEIISLFEGEINYFSEIQKNLKLFFSEKIEINNEQKEILNKNKNILLLFKKYLEEGKFEFEEIFSIFFKIKEKTNFSIKEIITSIRISITGKIKGPKIKYLIFYLGKEKVLKFIDDVIKRK